MVWIRGATLVDGTGAPALADSWVLIRGNRILAVGPGGSFPKPRGARVIRARGMTLLPGLIDVHVHLGGSGVVGYTYLRPQPHGQEVFLRNLRAELLGGVTLVRDLHMPLEMAGQLLAVLRKNPTRGARLLYAGPILTSEEGYGTPYAVPVATPEEGKQRVAELHREGAGVIKIAVTSRNIGGGILPAMTADVARSIVEEAHGRGLPVAAHVAGATAAELRVAIEAGVDSLEHLPGIHDPMALPDTFLSSDGWIDEIRRRGITIVPTLSVEAGEDFGPSLPALLEDPSLGLKLSPEQLDVLGRNREDFLRNPRRQAIARAARERFEVLLDEVGRLHRAGVKMAAGSDAGNGFTFHGNLRTEIGYLVRAGFTPLEAIEAATRTGAELLRVSDRLGTVEVGKTADLLLIRGNPLQDLGALERVEMVLIDGRTVDVGRLVKEAGKQEEEPPE